MEITVNYFLIKRSLLSALRRSRKEAENILSKFDPFYDWYIGPLNGKKLKKEIEHILEFGSISFNDLKQPQVFYDLTLVATIFSESEKPIDWFKLRKEFDSRKISEFINPDAHISFIERIDKSAMQKKLAGGDEMFDFDSTTSTDEIIEELTDILNEKILRENWIIYTKLVDGKINTYQINIANQYLATEQNDLIKASEVVKSFFEEHQYCIDLKIESKTKINLTRYYIMGVFTMDT